MAGRKKGSNLQKAAQRILEKNGKDFNEWKKDVINQRKLAIMSDQDKEWTEQTIEEAALQIVLKDINTTKTDSSNLANTNHN